MTIAAIIERVDALKPNKFTTAQKVSWLSDIDSAIWTDIISTHAADETTPEAFNGYGEETPLSTILLAPAPHDVLYRHGLSMQIDLNNMELAKYNNSAALYNTALSTFAAWYNRTHMPNQIADHLNY